MRVVLIPGFTQTARSWDATHAAIGAVHAGLETFVALPPPRRSWDAAVQRIAAASGRGTWVGYSMGGRLALAVALAHPRLVDDLVLVSATAGIADPVQRRQRVAEDETLAASIEVDGVAAFLEKWLAQPMFSRLPADASGVADRRNWHADDLASILRNLGTGAMPNLWERLGELTGRVTIVTGVHDPKFDAIGDRLASGCDHATVRRVRCDAGHAIPLEAPAFLGPLLQND